MNQPEIHIQDIGAVEEFRYTMEQPGLHILKGKPGSGKSTIIRSIQMVMGEDVTIKPTRRDGTPRGLAQVAGKSVRIMKTTREEGELVGVQSLGELNIYDLHSPPHKTATTRDKHRIAALVTLTGAKVEPTDFHYLLGKDTFESVVPSDALQTDDPIEMTARIKRAIEREALRLEALERTAQANALAENKATEGFDLENLPNEDALQTGLEQAIRASSAAKDELSVLERKGREARLARKKADEARARLEEVGSGITRKEAVAALEQAEVEVDALKGLSTHDRTS
jgi:energy-coupling factor transporter ATP-binding protein EcfA2